MADGTAAIMDDVRDTADRKIERAPLVTGNRTMAWISDHVATVTEKRAPPVSTPPATASALALLSVWAT